LTAIARITQTACRLLPRSRCDLQVAHVHAQTIHRPLNSSPAQGHSGWRHSLGVWLLPPARASWRSPRRGRQALDAHVHGATSAWIAGGAGAWPCRRRARCGHKVTRRLGAHTGVRHRSLTTVGDEAGRAVGAYVLHRTGPRRLHHPWAPCGAFARHASPGSAPGSRRLEPGAALRRATGTFGAFDSSAMRFLLGNSSSTSASLRMPSSIAARLSPAYPSTSASVSRPGSIMCRLSGYTRLSAGRPVQQPLCIDCPQAHSASSTPREDCR